MKVYSLKIKFLLINTVVFIILSIAIVFFVNHFVKQNAFKHAEEKSALLIKHNLAIHSYINTNLKPTLFALTDTIRETEYFDPRWMSSTYVVRDIDKLYHQNDENNYYYKEAAINARSPENEADDFERDFIHKLNRDKNVNKTSGVRIFDGKPYFFTLIRGESMEKGCLRCHSTSDKAPANLVKTYGDSRSFNRTMDETVSAISIRMPLEQPYREANILSAKLSGMLIVLLLITFSLQSRFVNQLVVIPLKRFKTETESITSNPENLGLNLPLFNNKEMDEIAVSFNNMSSKLKDVVDNLEITVRERTADLKISEERFRLILETVAVVPWEFNIPENRWVYVGNQVTDLLGYASEEWTTLEWWLEIIHPEDKTWVPAYCADLTSRGEKHSMEYRLLAKDGSFIWVNDLVTVEMLNGKPHIMRGVIVDINNRKKAEEEKYLLEQQLQQTQKLESLGVLAGGIAHDFNNILAIIIGYCSLTKLDYETAENNIDGIEKAAERAAALCRQMMAYAGKAQLTKAQINMRMVVDEMVTMLKSTLPQNAVIKSDLSAKIPYISADESQIRQIIMNLIINASEAIGAEQGEIQVSLFRTTVSDGQATKDYHGISIPLGEYVCLEVTDNGCGMDEETKWRIFEPFYTTKFTGRGLGMSAVLGIIKSHAGALQLHSQLGQGSSFKVYLPVQKSDSVSDENTSTVPSAPWKGNGTILLVEDEDQVRLIAKALLKNFGFTVLEAVNGNEALELYQRKATDITLVLTDMGMPIMDGYELFYELKKLNHELPIIVSSGYGDAEISSRIGLDNIAGLISKPYNPEQLREVLKRAFDDLQ